MDIKKLKAVGGIVTDQQMTKVSKTWTSPNGENFEVDFWVRRQSFASVEKLWQQSEKQDRSHSSNAAFIAECIRLGEDGKEQLTYADACELEPSLAVLFVSAINEVLSPKKTPPTTSGTSSSSRASGAGRSKKPSNE